MKKIFKGLLCLGLCGALAVGAAGCSNSAHRDPEKDALKLAIGAVDGKFNPLFYTSQNDGEIANMTQISLVTSERNPVNKEKSYLAYGENYPTVALDYKETYYNSDNQVAAYGDGKDVLYNTGYTGADTNADGSTTYEFVIKNDVMFSDGEHKLTVMDVLFNLYVYLDPVYSGSSTIYSTKIKGLQAYREQRLGADGEHGSTSGNSESNRKYYGRALERIKRLTDWLDNFDGELKDKDGNFNATGEIKTDLEKIEALYKDEVASDWNATSTGFVEAYKSYRFTEAWQAFYYAQGLVNKRKVMSDVTFREEDAKDAADKYLTTLDYNNQGDDDPALQDNLYRKDLVEAMAEATTDAEIKKFMDENEGYTRENAILELQKKEALSKVLSRLNDASGIEFILGYTATGSNMIDYCMQAEMTKDRPAGELNVPTVEGITVERVTEFTDAKGNKTTYDEPHDKLKIEIYGVDPKAKWNFGFTVAPMFYYSDGVSIDGKGNISNNAGSVYYKAAMDDYQAYLDQYTANKTSKLITNFGVRYKDIDWLSDVCANEYKNKVPMGAGAYRCCTNRFETTGVNKDNFYYNNITFFARNDNFETLGSGVSNAKIKFITYTVTPDDKIVESLQTGAIDYGTPTATYVNQNAVQTGDLKQITYRAGGYGYVGINPKYVKELEVRQAIMHAFDTSWITQYYGGSLVSLINRPMSMTSWAYPEKASRAYPMITEVNEIKKLVADSGVWEFNESTQRFEDANGSPLKITFTIAGDTTDHPSFRMFVAAEKFLESCGFDITVETRSDALQKLVTGDLQVWAAAWSSSIDPDPYQIYSINSNASSTKNWYKDGIMNDSGSVYGEEQKIAQELSELIEQGRSILVDDDRIPIYEKCLNKIMELAVEFPTYQRNDLCVYNSAVLDESSINLDASFNKGPIDEIWKLAYKK